MGHKNTVCCDLEPKILLSLKFMCRFNSTNNMEHIAEMSLNFNIHLAILTVLRKECQTFPALRFPHDSGVTVLYSMWK